MRNPLMALRAELMDLYKLNGQEITQSYLRLEVNLDTLATNTALQFPVLKTDQVPGATTVSPIENRLQVSDAFVATAVSLFIYKSVTSSDADRAQSIPSYFPNPLIYTGAEALAQEQIYNGNLKMTINSFVYFTALDCQRFRRVATAQQGVLGGTGGVITQRDGVVSENSSFIGLNPTLTIGGQSKNEFVVNLPGNTTLAGASATVNYAVLYFRGFQLQGAALKFQQMMTEKGAPVYYSS